MVDSPLKKRVVPAALGLGMLVVVVAAALVPNTGAIPAQTQCQYNVCPTNENPTISGWEIALIVVAVLAAIMAALFIVRRRRGGGPPPPAQEWQPPPGAGGPAGPVAEAAPQTYLETPEDFGLPPLEPAAPPPVAPPPQGEADIDSLLQELDSISGEILKRGVPPKKGTPPSGEKDESSSR